MELRHMRYYLAVAEALSFRRAAEKLRVAQPALSAQIRDLEEELGVKLLERTTRRVRLTMAGRVFLSEARFVIDSAEEGARRAKQAQAGLIGTLRVGVIAPAANAWLAQILRKYQQKFPGVQLVLSDLTSTEQLQQLRSDDLDVGLLRPPIGSPDLEAMLVAESSQLLALPKGHRLAEKRPLSWEDFHEETMVLLHPSVQHGYYDPFFAACARAGAKPRVGQYARDIQIKLWLISAGFGIAPTTATLKQVKRPGLIFKPLPPGLRSIHTVLVWRRNNESLALASFRGMFRDLGNGQKQAGQES